MKHRFLLMFLTFAYADQIQEKIYKNSPFIDSYVSPYANPFHTILKAQTDQESLHKQTQYAILSNTIPKCGTHLFAKCLSLITGRKASGMGVFEGDFPHSLSKLTDSQGFYHGHTWPRKDILNIFSQDSFRLFMMMRDPRDLIISLVLWLKKIRNDCKTKSFDELYEELLMNPGLSNHYNNFFTPDLDLSLEDRYKIFLTRWGSLPNMLIIRFEDIVGLQGGGSSEVQKQVLLEVGRHLEIELSDQNIHYIQKNLFGNTGTFREGQIGGWKKHFTPERKALFKKYFSTEYLIELGYETSYNW